MTSLASRMPSPLLSMPDCACVPPLGQEALPTVRVVKLTRLFWPLLPAAPVAPCAPLHTSCVLVISLGSRTPLPLVSTPELTWVPPFAHVALPAASATKLTRLFKPLLPAAPDAPLQIYCLLVTSLGSRI